MHTARPDTLSRQRGCLYGGAAGDALGYPVEFMSRTEIINKYGPYGIRSYELHGGEARISDDTQMLLFTLEAIYLWRSELRTKPDKALRTCLFDAYRDWLYTQENYGEKKQRHKARTRLYLMPEMHKRRGPGFTCIRSLQQKRPGSMVNPINDSKGNGGVMRVAPIGFSFNRDEYDIADIIRLGAESAALTHGHPLGFIAAGMLAGLINEIIFAEPESLASAIKTALDMTARIFGDYPDMRTLIDLISLAMKLAVEASDDIAAIGALGDSQLAESTLAIAIYCALKYENDFCSAIACSVNINGDSDTVAAVTGNILGAWLGIDKIGSEWTDPLPISKYLKVLEYYSE